MRLAIVGQQDFGKAALEAFVKRGDDVAAVFCAPEKGRPDPLRLAAEAAAKGRDIVLCSTSSLDPVFFKKWVEPGMHLSTIKGHEIEPAAINA